MATYKFFGSILLFSVWHFAGALWLSSLGLALLPVTGLTLVVMLCGLYAVHFVEQRRIAIRDLSFAIRLPFMVEPRRRLRRQRDALIVDLEGLAEKHGLLEAPAD